MVHRRSEFRAERILQERLHAHPNITVLWNKEVREFVDGGGTAGLVALDLEDTRTGELVEELAKDTAVQESDTVLVTVPNQLGVEYNARLLENIIEHVAKPLGWK